jgi:hypothetical protein
MSRSNSLLSVIGLERQAAQISALSVCVPGVGEQRRLREGSDEDWDNSRSQRDNMSSAPPGSVPDSFRR